MDDTSPRAIRRCVLIEYGNVRIEATVEGTGPPIVMLPSSGRGCDDFDVVAAALARAGFRVIRPQPRGIGRSAGPMTGITLHDFARDVAHVIEAQADGRAIIIGHAFGNWIARCMAADFPDLVRGVVLAAAAAKAFPPGLSEALGVCSDASRPDKERIEALKKAFFARGHDPRIWLTGWYPATMSAERLASQNTNQDDWWSGGTVPMLDLQAGADPWRPKSTRDELRNEFPDRVSVSVVAQASHALFPERPRSVAEKIIDWAGEITGRRPAPSTVAHGEPKMEKDLMRSMASEMTALPTDIHVEGPFYRPNAPASCDLYPSDSHGPVLWFRGTVCDIDLDPVPDATIEVWHADERGRYDNDDPENLPPPQEFRCRGIMQADENGLFEFRTVRPANYKVDPNSDWVRVKHVHFKVYKLGYQPLTTEIALLPDEHARPATNDDGSPDKLGDALFDPKLAAYLEPCPDENGRQAFRAYFNFLLMKIAPRGYAVHAARLVRAR